MYKAFAELTRDFGSSATSQHGMYLLTMQREQTKGWPVTILRTLHQSTNHEP